MGQYSNAQKNQSKRLKRSFVATNSSLGSLCKHCQNLARVVFKMADTSLPKSDVQEKVLKYEEFIDKRLRKDLETVYKAQEDLYTKINEYTQLKNTIKQLQKSHPNGEKLKTMVDLGTNFYCEAEVPDTSMIYVAVGFGFYVQFTFEEALNFIEKKCGILNSTAEKLCKDAAKVKAHMKVVLGGLQELQNISFGEDDENTY